VGHPQKLGERLEQAPRALRKNRSCWYLDLSELRQERFLCFRATWFDNLLQQPQEMNIRAPYHVTLFHNSDWKPHSHEPSTLCEDKVVVMVKNHELAGHSGSHLFFLIFILFIYAYNGWVISTPFPYPLPYTPCSLPLPHYPLTSWQKLFCPYL
jgi:hypothetical protein